MYIELVGSLLYITHSQPILAYVVGFVSMYMKESHNIHLKDAKIMLHYVQGTKHFGVHYVASSPLELVGFTDSDWDGDSIDRNSTLGYVFMLSNGPIF